MAFRRRDLRSAALAWNMRPLAAETEMPMRLAAVASLVAGGGHVGDNSGAGEFSQQIYSPPYLFNGPRPTITSAPATSTYNTSITVQTPEASSISSVNLVSLGTDTHQSDMAQHFVPLSFTAAAGRSMTSPAAMRFTVSGDNRRIIGASMPQPYHAPGRICHLLVITRAGQADGAGSASGALTGLRSGERLAVPDPVKRTKGLSCPTHWTR